MSFHRLRAYQPKKTSLLWAFVAGATLTALYGFVWGGWLTETTATRMRTEAVNDARAQLTADACVERFLRAPDAVAKLTTLKATSFWERDAFIEKGGWATLPGLKEPVANAAELCAEKLNVTKLPRQDATADTGRAVQ